MIRKSLQESFEKEVNLKEIIENEINAVIESLSKAIELREKLNEILNKTYS